ncbi:hypothetical protein EZV77_16090 [Burkholderia thailandensis]|nr:hypothetical protein A8H32_30620 [Burkholderia thailandensis]MDD1483813.1 hypothetical protein [Burkholderia thailandensis]MDD1490013.1 hypothetical protein [Burkholderia thailandensis]MDD1495940.1 hypothetical protein [Burkholderia thailandensis]PJO68684.1 hypothetical protein CWD92_31240 [Burkholderia thailandensis]
MRPSAARDAAGTAIRPAPSRDASPARAAGRAKRGCAGHSDMRQSKVFMTFAHIHEHTKRRHLYV